MRNRLTEVSSKLVAIVVLVVAVIPNITFSQDHGGGDGMNIYLVIRFEADDPKLAEFSVIMKNVENDMQTERGFESATVYQNTDDPRVFTLIELW